ncbi:MAG: hypothetical protein LW630_09795 [Saprospiraceae bacterium]|jgi:hypothetical protein|nr:hypothetical protein [Saprospiraceae bacterium]
MKKLVLLGLFSSSWWMISSQNISDVARWSAFEPLGTARILATGGSFGSLGGDFSSLSINPAGIGDYRLSECTFTPSMRTVSAASYFEADPNATATRKITRLGLDNLGLVIAGKGKKNWTSSNFAAGFSRTADHRRNAFLAGRFPGSITTYFAEQANGNIPDNLDDFIAFPAYNTGAIYDFDEDRYYETDFTDPDQPVLRSQQIVQTGGVNELSLGWAGEYKSTLNLGVSLGVPFASFEELKTYRENDEADEIPVFNNLKYTEIVSTSGVGVNLKMGYTYKFLEYFRIGMAFHTPTWYKFTDNYSTSLEYAYNDGTNQRYSFDSPEGIFEYKMTTPWRALGSLGAIFRSGDYRGFINGDVEYLDYTSAYYNGTAYSSAQDEFEWTNEVNQNILAKFGNAVNVRLGGEVAYKSFRFRMGYSWERTAFIADNFYNKKWSWGIGFRENNFFIDFGMRRASYDEGYNPYVVTDTTKDPLSVIQTNRNRGALTLGFKF